MRVGMNVQRQRLRLLSIAETKLRLQQKKGDALWAIWPYCYEIIRYPPDWGTHGKRKGPGRGMRVGRTGGNRGREAG